MWIIAGLSIHRSTTAWPSFVAAAAEPGRARQRVAFGVNAEFAMPIHDFALDAVALLAMSPSAHQASPRSNSLRMSSTRHAVMRGPSLTGLGKRPDLTPAHQV